MQTNVNVPGLTVDPETGAELSLDQIHSLVDDLLEAHGDWIPELTATALLRPTAVSGSPRETAKADFARERRRRTLASLASRLVHQILKELR